MYTRDTHQKRADGTSLVHIQIVESLWNKQRKRSETHVVYDFGRADKPETIDRMKALAKTILRRCSLEAVAEASGMKLQFAWPFGDLFVFEEYWKRLGIPEAISMAMAGRQIEFSVERALFAMVANRACAPVSKLCCHEEWLREDVNIPGTECLGLHHLYRAMDFLEENQAAIEKKLYDNLSNLFNLDVELVFYDTTSIWFDIDEEDEPGKLDIDEAESSTSAGNALRKRGNAKDKRGEPQLVIGMVVTRDGFPVRHWVFPGNTVDVDTVAQVKADLKEWKLTRCVFVGDAGMVSAENLKKLAESGGKFIVCMSTGGKDEVSESVLTHPGRFKKVADNLEVKEVVIGDGERRRRYVLCFNPQEAARQKKHRERILADLTAELESLRYMEKGEGPTRRVCALRASQRYGRYLQFKAQKLEINQAKVKQEEKRDGKFVVHSNDDTLTPEDLALAYKQLARAEEAWRTLKSGSDLSTTTHNTGCGPTSPCAFWRSSSSGPSRRTAATPGGTSEPSSSASSSGNCRALTARSGRLRSPTQMPEKY